MKQGLNMAMIAVCTAWSKNGNQQQNQKNNLVQRSCALFRQSF